MLRRMVYLQVGYKVVAEQQEGALVAPAERENAEALHVHR